MTLRVIRRSGATKQSHHLRDCFAIARNDNVTGFNAFAIVLTVFSLFLVSCEPFIRKQPDFPVLADFQERVREFYASLKEGN